MTKSSNSITEWLWNKNVSPENYGSKEQYYEHIFEQYKMSVEMADRVSARRNLANTFFLTLHTLIIGGVAIVFESKLQLSNVWLIIFPLLTVLALCYVWWRLLWSYRQLNSAKYQVIEHYEKQLPTSPYVSAEWRILGEGKDPKQYKPMTDVEQSVPLIFSILYLIGAALIIFS